VTVNLKGTDVNEHEKLFNFTLLNHIEKK